jgi:hypothetical protein
MDQRKRYRLLERPPDITPNDYEFRIETMVLLHVLGKEEGKKSVTLSNDGTPMSMQMEVWGTIATPNVVLTRIMNQNGQGGEFQTEAEEF